MPARHKRRGRRSGDGLRDRAVGSPLPAEARPSRALSAWELGYGRRGGKCRATARRARARAARGLIPRGVEWLSLKD